MQPGRALALILALLVLSACRTKDADDSAACVEQTFYADLDGDGYGNTEDEVQACDLQAPYVSIDGDCDDADADIFPGAAERCNGLDDSCDGSVDEGLEGTFYTDEDQDGFGVDPVEGCDGSGLASTDGDCVDTDATIHPDAVEVCDGIDNDCDELVDDDDDSLDMGSATTWYEDADGDGFPVETSNQVLSCVQPSGYAPEADWDCDDDDDTVYAGADELCDGLDNDCDGVIPEEEVDTDGDGWVNCTIDAGGWDGPVVTGGGDCGGDDESIYVGAPELCDGQDNDCDGDLDPTEEDDDADGWVECALDADGWDGATISGGEDCDDEADDVYPGADEYCDSIDQDCDGDTRDDDSLDTSTWYADDDQDGDGDSATTTEACDQPSGYVGNDDDCDDDDDTVYDGADELCDGQDNDCDGSQGADEDDDDGDFYVECTIDAGGWDGNSSILDGDDCDDGDTSINPGASEICDGIDQDCDGSADNGVLGSGSTCAAVDCLEIIADQPSAASGSYTLTNGTYECDMGTDGGGWTKVGDNHPIYGTGFDSTTYNSEDFEYGEIFFDYDSGSTHGHCTYPGSMTGCVPWGFRFNGNSSWYGPQNWGSSTCGMAVSSAFTSYSTLSGNDVFIHYEDQASSTTTASIQMGMLEGISGCTTGDNYGTAYVDIWVR